MRCLIRIAVRNTLLLATELFHPGSPRACRGQDLVEYALMAGFVAVAVAAIIPYQVTGPISGIFSKIEFYMKTVGNG